MASHCDLMVLNLRMSSFNEAFLKVQQWVMHYVLMQLEHNISSSATRGAKGASALKNLPKVQALKFVLNLTCE